MSEIEKLLNKFEEDPSLSRAVETVTRLRVIARDILPRVRIAILRNFTLEQLQPYLELRCAQLGVFAEVYFADLATAQRDVRDPESDLFKFRPEITIVAFRLEVIVPDLTEKFCSLTAETLKNQAYTACQLVLNTVHALRVHSECLTLVHNFEPPRFPAKGILDAGSVNGQLNTIRRINLDLAVTLASFDQVHIVDITHVFGCVGFDKALDSRFWHMARAPYSPSCLDALASQHASFAGALKGKTKKCLVLDCDNTLWGGVVGEEGMGGIKLGTMYPGSAFRSFQLAALDFYHRGVLLALNSKNNEVDVLNVLTNHPDCLLHPEHFACVRVNWQDKVSNLREIANELNIGLDSLVFVDDNEMECDFVRNSLPEVKVVCLTKDATRHESQLRALRCFETLTLTKEDIQRTSLYQAERIRREMKDTMGSYDEYLQTLEMTLTIEKDNQVSAPRIAQLTQKTNQFNLTTRRYSEPQIRTFLESDDITVYSLRLADKFGDSGLIGVAIVRRDQNLAIIDTMLLSCRVIGRGVEDAILATVAANEKASGSTVLIGERIETDKNQITANFYSGKGFTEDDPGTFKLPLENHLPQAPNWFKEILITQ
jgi:FkbH-like protein